MTEMTTKNIGLRGVTVADTKISKVDGESGRLIYRGYQIQDLARQASFEEVVHLLLVGRLPSAEELGVVDNTLRESRPLPDEMLSILRARNKNGLPMDVLQGAISAMADSDEDLGSRDRDTTVRSALRIIAQTTSVVAAWYHLCRGEEPAQMDQSLSLAGAFLKAIWKRQPNDDEIRLMDSILVLHAEHALNASTFAVREVASTRAHIYASISAGVGALSGPLHGGANARVMEMLRQIGGAAEVERWVQSRVDTGKRVMGLGHAVYKTEDPRAGILRDVAHKALAGTENEHWFQLALAVDETARRALKERRNLDLYPNVDFFSGPVLSAMRIPDNFFPVIFAMSRVAGWCAHFIEEQFAEAQPKAVLYRPRANYTGRDCGSPGCRYVPLENRGAGCPCGDTLNTCAEELAIKDIRAAISQEEGN